VATQRKYSGQGSDPAPDLLAVTGDNNKDLPFTTRGLYVGTTGDVKIDTEMGTTVTLKNLAAGMVHPIAARRVYATGTTAADILGVF
jgi:hypothetical protein